MTTSHPLKVVEKTDRISGESCGEESGRPKTRRPERAGHFYKPRTSGTLKASMAALVSACGGHKKSADLTGSSPTRIFACTDEQEPDKELKPSQIRVLERDSGQPLVTAFLAAAQGCALIPLEFDDDAPLATDMAQFGERVATVFSRYAAAMADGKLTPREAGELHDEILRVFGAGAAMLSDLEAVMAEKK